MLKVLNNLFDADESALEVGAIPVKQCPTGKSAKTCPAVCRKIFRFPRRANQRYQLAPSCTSQRGALRDRHERWVRDAVDAAVRETGAPMRTAKSCGPDTPTLVSSFQEANASRERRWQESPVTGESTL